VALISAENEGENPRKSGGSLFFRYREGLDPHMRVRVRYREGRNTLLPIWKFAGEFESVRYREVSVSRGFTVFSLQILYFITMYSRLLKLCYSRVLHEACSTNSFLAAFDYVTFVFGNVR